MLLSAVLREGMAKNPTQYRGIKWTLFSRLDALQRAGDIVLLPDKYENMQSKSNSFAVQVQNQQHKEACLRINT